MDFYFLLFAPDIAKLERPPGRGRDLRLFAVHAVSDDLLQGDKAGHGLFAIWMERFPHQTVPGEGFCPPGFVVS